MTELEYTLLVNRVHVTTAKNIISKLITGEDWGVTQGQKRTVLDILYSAESKLFGMTETEDER